MRKKTKYIINIFTVFIVTFIFYGCAESTLNSTTIDNHQWLSIPYKEVLDGSLILYKEPRFPITKIIDGRNGGKIELHERYRYKGSNEVKVEASLEFPKDAFVGQRTIVLKIEKDYGNTTFLPHGDFNLPAIYSVRFEGLDLSSVDPTTINFVYFSESGAVEFISSDKIKVDAKKGILEVKEALLPHFSRYGFISVR